MLRLEVWTEPSETGLLGLQLGAWNLGAKWLSCDGSMSRTLNHMMSTSRSKVKKSKQRAASPVEESFVEHQELDPKPGRRCLLMLALVLARCANRGPGPAWAGPRVSPDWKCNKTAGATGICDDHPRVTSQKKRKRGDEGDQTGSPAVGGWPTTKTGGRSLGRTQGRDQSRGSWWWWCRWSESQPRLRFKMRWRASWEGGRGGRGFWRGRDKRQLRKKKKKKAASS